MEYYYELFEKLNNISKYVGGIFLAVLVVDSLIFTLIPLVFIKYLGISLVSIYLIGYISYYVFNRYCCSVFGTGSPKDDLWTFKDFLDCYNGKIYEDYFSPCDNYDFFEDAMDKFSELFNCDGKDNFGRICQHFKYLYEHADDDSFIYNEKNYDDDDEKHMIEDHDYHFLIMKYNQLSDYVKSHNHNKLWHNFSDKVDSWHNNKCKQPKMPNTLVNDIHSEQKLIED